MIPRTLILRPVSLALVVALALVLGLALTLPGALAADPPVDKLSLAKLLRNDDFKTLEARLTSYQAGFESGRVAEDVVVRAFEAFENSDPKLKAKLDAWNVQFPGSYAAALARGQYYRRLGWLARGGRYASKTPGKRFVTMKEYHARAENDLRRAIEINPRLSAAYALLINIAKAGGRKSLRDETLRRGLAAAPRSLAIRHRYLLALLPWWGGSMAEIKAFIARMRRAPGYHAGLKPLEGFADMAAARQLQKQGKRAAAVAHYQRALKHGAYWLYYYERGANFYFLKLYDAARKDLDRAAQLRPQDTTILAIRARLHDKAGRRDDAFDDWDIALRLDPFAPKILEYRSYALVRANRRHEALDDLDRALVYGARDSFVREARGRLYLYSFKNYAASTVEMQHATRLNPGEARHWYYLGYGLYQERDCRMVPAFTTYVGLCGKGGRCPEDRLAWVKRALNTVTRKRICRRE